MALSTQPYKGARDFYPEDKRIQKYMFKTIRKVVQRFGYEEYDAPFLEPTELYASKTSDEIVNEQTYSFTDRGDRSVTIRTEMTPSVSRMVAAKRQELAYPLRWYSIPNLWRYERPQRGRLREFFQPNVDIFGVDGIEADHEIILIADTVMQAFKAKRDMYTIKLNSRQLMDGLLADYLGLDQVQVRTMAQLIDRMHKMDYAEFVGLVDGVLKVGSLDELPEPLHAHPSVNQLRTLMEMLEASGVSNFIFDPTLMRGFDYYTDIVFEVFDNHPDNNRAMYGGGRYNGLIAAFGVEPVPSVGFAMGDVTLQNFLESHELMPKLHTETDVYVILIGDVYLKAQKALKELRDAGVKIAIDITGRKPDKQIKTAVKKGIHYALFIGDRELESEQYVLKNLMTGADEQHGINRTVSIVKDYRAKKQFK